MVKIIFKRLLLMLPMLLGMSVIVFALLRLTPGDPASSILGAYATPDQLRQVRHDLGLDRSIYSQYVYWLGGLLHGDLGSDYTSGQSISEVLVGRLPVTGEVVVLAFVLALVVGIPLGVVSACRHERSLDRGVKALSVLGVAVPNFFLAVILILVFSLGLGLFPSSGFVSVGDGGVFQNLRSIILPAVALAAGLAAVLIRMTRGAMLDALSRDHIVLCKAMGFSESSITWKHALRSAGVPIVTVAGLQAGYLLGSTIVVEQVFGLPGVGQLIVQSMLNHNYPDVQASVLVICVIFIVVNVLVDLSYLVISPKLRHVT